MESSVVVNNFSVIQKQLETGEITSIQALDKAYATILTFVFGGQNMDVATSLFASGMLEGILNTIQPEPYMDHILMRLRSYLQGLKKGRSLTMEELLSD